MFSGLLLLGSIPLGLAPLVRSVEGLYVSRFFIGILGGTLVPCQVWSMTFFDKNIVGTANALAGGFGTAGGGITYFIMPAVYDSFVARGHSVGQSWRLTFIVPLIMVIFVGIALLVLCPDTPTGPWAQRHNAAQDSLECHSVDYTPSAVAVVPGAITDKHPSATTGPLPSTNNSSAEKLPNKPQKDEHTPSPSPPSTRGPTPLPFDRDPEAQHPSSASSPISTVPIPPTPAQALRIAVSPQTVFHVLAYMNSFGAELAINAVLSSYYIATFPALSQTDAANRAAVFGFLNFVTRPLGGVVSDLLYKYSRHNLWFKKAWVVACGLTAGSLLIVLGRVDPRGEGAVFGLVSLVAVFLQAGNGANFSLVPHVHPGADGLLSGLTGAGGNLGGVVFSVIFRFMDGGTNYAKGFWVIGVIHVGVSLLVGGIPPLPRGRVEGQ